MNHTSPNQINNNIPLGPSMTGTTHSTGDSEFGVPQSSSTIGISNPINKNEKYITIHVIDDNNKTKKDFTIERKVLTTYMKYFEQCLKGIPEKEEIDISVHCDAKIFEWLLKYVKAKELKQSEDNNFGSPSSSGWTIKVKNVE
jgi:hypothetical protein